MIGKTKPAGSCDDLKDPPQAGITSATAKIILKKIRSFIDTLYKRFAKALSGAGLLPERMMKGIFRFMEKEGIDMEGKVRINRLRIIAPPQEAN
jgi:hypothetical protein